MFYTYDDRANREDLLDVITNIDPVNNYLLKNLGTTAATGIRHEWTYDTLPAVTAGTVSGQVEGFTPAYGNATNPTRDANYCMIISSEWEVTRTEQKVLSAGAADNRFAYEQDKAMKHWANQAENAILHGTLATGTGSAARQMKGIKRFASTLLTSFSATTIVESDFRDFLGNGWSQGIELDTVIVPKTLKNRIDSFTSGNTKYIEAAEKRVIGFIDVYESAYGVITIVKHRLALDTASNRDLIMFQSDKLKVSYLDKPHMEAMAKTSDSEKGIVVGELTAEVRHEKAVSWVRNVL